MYQYTSAIVALGAEVYPEVPRNWSKAVPEGNGYGSHHTQPTLVDIYPLFEERFDRQLNIMKSHFDEQDETLDEFIKTRESNRRLEELLHRAQQSRLAMEADVKLDSKTRKRAEDAAADQARYEDSCSAKGSMPNLPWLLKNASLTPWSTKALQRQIRVSHP